MIVPLNASRLSVATASLIQPGFDMPPYVPARRVHLESACAITLRYAESPARTSKPQDESLEVFLYGVNTTLALGMEVQIVHYIRKRRAKNEFNYRCSSLVLKNKI